MKIFLIGMRGSGKSAAGQAVANRLKVAFLDADEEIARRAGKSIAQIFASHGEKEFRRLERELMREVLLSPEEPHVIVATGGGCILDDEIRALLKNHPGVVWLDANISLLAARIRGSARPSLTGREPAEEVAQIFAEREPHYRDCACLRIDSSTKNIEEVADVLEQFWQNLPRHYFR